MRTNAGTDWQSAVLGNSQAAGAGTGAAAPAQWIAFTENATAPAASDTSLTGELTTDGFARSLATYAHTAGVASYTLTKSVTATGGPRTAAKVGVFNAAAAGILVFAQLVPSPTTQLSGDTTAFTVPVTL